MDVGGRSDGRSRRKASLLDVLTEVPAAARELIEHLRNSGDLKSARLACHALCTFIDENVEELHLHFHDVVLAMCVPGHWGHLSLARWPNCSSVQMSVSVRSFLAFPLSTGLIDMVSAPFTGLGPDGRARIRKLQLLISPSGLLPTLLMSPEAIVRSTISLLPNLRSLDIRGVDGIPGGPLPQQLLFDSLATLPHLEELLLPGTRTLDRIGTLAGNAAGASLKRLVVQAAVGEPPLSKVAVEGLSRLSGLEVLDLQDVDARRDVDTGAATELAALPDASLIDLLDALPLSLKQLRLTSSSPATPACVLSLRDGRLQSLETSGAEFSVGNLLVLATDLMASRVMASTARPHGVPPSQSASPAPAQEQHQLDHLLVRDLTVTSLLPPEDFRPPPPLQELLRRCRKVEVERLHVPSAAQLPPLLEAFGKPRELRKLWQLPIVLSIRREQEPPDWTPAAEEDNAAAAASSSVGGRQSAVLSSPMGAARSPILPSGEELTQRVVQRLLGDPVGAAAASSGQDTRGVAACPPGSPERTRASYASGVLLLRGKFFHLLAKVNLFPPWVKRTLAKSEAAGNAAVAAANLTSYVVLPAATEAGLIDCGSEEGAEAVAAALRAGGQGELEVLPVVTELQREEHVSDPDESEFEVIIYRKLLGEVVQELWDQRWANGAAAALGEKELLRQLVGLMDTCLEGVNLDWWVHADD